MLRFDTARLQVVFGIFLLAILFTASIGGVTAQNIPPSNSPDTASLAAKTKNPTKTPNATKTRKPKKTTTPSPTSTETETPTVVPTETETGVPTETGIPTQELETPTSQADSASATPAKTRKPKKTRTPMPTATTTAPLSCADGSLAVSTVQVESSISSVLQSPDCRISIHFAPETFTESLTAHIRYTQKNPGIQQVVNRFELRFLNADGKRLKHPKFNHPVTLQVQYDPRALGALHENILDLVTWNKKLKNWVPMYSKLDTQAHTLTVETTALAAQAGITSLEDLQPYLPSLQGFQNDLFSGAAGASYPLTVPPGQGGLQPKLVLSYSSNVADNFDSNTQASYVGVGWSLDTGYIIRDERNYNDNNTDMQLNFFSLVLDGASYDLVPETGSTTVYHTSNETYWSITNDNSNATNPDPLTWTITTNDGTVYVFGNGGAFRGNWYRRNPVNQGVSSTPQNYMWMLKSITDVHGNVINYTYLKDTATCPVNSGSYATALYPNTIKYNYSGTNALSEIDFDYGTTARTDQAVHFPTTQCGVAPFMTKALYHVIVKTALNANNLTPQAVRQYDFAYNNGTSSSVVFTGIPYTNTNTTNPPRGALGLTHFWQQDPSDDNAQLNEGIFGYGSSGSASESSHLKTIENGINGTVTFGYQTKTSAGFSLPSADPWDAVYDTVFLCTSTACDWKGNNASVGIASDTSCGTNSDKALTVHPNAGGGYASYRVYPFAPTGQYSIDVKVEGDGGSSNVWVGASKDIDNPGTEFVSSATQGVSSGSCTDFTVGDTTSGIGFSLPANAEMLQVNIHTTGNVKVKKVTVHKLGVFPHVVVSKALDDGLGGVDTWTYNYAFANNMAVNDENTSDVILNAGCYPSHPGGAPSTCVYLRQPYGNEFRGFNKVVVTDPKGNFITHRFYQDDLFKGKEHTVIEQDGDPSLSTTLKYRQTDTTFDSTATVPVNVNGDQSNFTFADSSTVTLYNPVSGNNVVARTQFTEYDYSTGCANGNLCKVTEHGDKTTTPGGPYERYTTYTYASLPGHILDKPAQKNVYNSANQLVSSSLNHYDDNGNGCFHAKGDLSSIDVNDGTQTFTAATYKCDGEGNHTSVKDALLNETTTQYDSLYSIFPTVVTNALGQTVTSAYNYKFGLPKSVTDLNGGITKYVYDVWGRKIEIWNPVDNIANQINATTLITYNLTDSPPNIQVSTRDDAGGTAGPVRLKQWYFFDGLGRSIQQQTRADISGVVDPVIVDTTYNGIGLVIKTTNPYAGSGASGVYQSPNSSNPVTKHAYDTLGREILTTNPDNTTKSMTYSLVSGKWTETVVDEKGHTKQIQTDGLDRTNAVIEYINSVPYTTAYSYDSLDHLTLVTDSASHQTNLQYDWLGHKTDMQDPDMGHWVYRYDLQGNLKRQTDARNNSICFNYDALNRASQKQARTGSDCNAGTVLYTVGFGYDSIANGNEGVGHRTSMTDPSGSSAWTFDSLGNLIQEDKTITGAPQTYTTKWDYGDAGQLTQLNYPVDNEAVCVAYNKQMLPISLTSAACGGSGSSYASSGGYNPAGQLVSLTLGNGLVTTYGYDPVSLRLNTLRTGPSNSIQNLSYTYEPNGNVLTISDALRSETSTFGYDDLDRLASATVTGGTSPYTQNWQYTPLGNIDWRKDNGVQTIYGYTDGSHIHAATSMGGTSYSYDPNGNMSTRGSDTFQYDAENRLTSITVGGTTTTYAYDGDGNRVKKTVGGTTTFYVGNYYEVTGSTVTKYYTLGSQRIALKQGSAVTYIHPDHLGGTSVTTNASGTCTSTQFYQPYGNIRSVSSPAPCGGTPATDYGFTGQRRDASAGLMYYGARYYDAGLGRFISADSVVPGAGNPQSLNRYAYVLNNPLKYSDPTGHCEEMGISPIPCAELIDDLSVAVSEDEPIIQKGLGDFIANEGPQIVEAGQRLVSGIGHVLSECVEVDCTEIGGEVDSASGPIIQEGQSILQGLDRFMNSKEEVLPAIKAAYEKADGMANEIDAIAGKKAWAIGNLPDTAEAAARGENILNDPNWTRPINYDWTQIIIKNGDVLHLVSTVTDENLISPRYDITVFARELDAFLQAGYTRVGDYLVPPQ